MKQLIKAIEKLIQVIQRKLIENDGWYVTIAIVDNGWILDIPSNNSDRRGKIVVVNPDAENGSKEHQEAVRKLLYEIRDAIDERYSKHNEWNLNIKLEHTNPQK